jgi:hypothetical protein
MAVAAERQVDALVSKPEARQAIAEPGLAHEINRTLLEHPGAHALDHVLPVAILDDERIDAAEVKEVSEHEPGRAGADDADLRSDPVHDNR